MLTNILLSCPVALHLFFPLQSRDFCKTILLSKTCFLCLPVEFITSESNSLLQVTHSITTKVWREGDKLFISVILETPVAQNIRDWAATRRGMEENARAGNFHELEEKPSIASLKQKYDKWIYSNRSIVLGVQELLKSAVYLMPHRYGAMEQTAEGATAILQMLTTYNKFSLMKLDFGTMTSPPLPGLPTLHCQGAWGQILDTVLGHTQLISEMLTLKHLGNKSRWMLVLLIECVKCWIRLKQLARRVAAARVSKEAHTANGAASSSAFYVHSKTWWELIVAQSKLSQKNDPFKPRVDTRVATCTRKQQAMFLQEMIGNKRLGVNYDDVYGDSPIKFVAPKTPPTSSSANNKKEPNHLLLLAILLDELRNDKSGILFAELMHICVPVIYALLVIKMGQKSWQAWGVAAVLEALSYASFSEQSSRQSSSSSRHNGARGPAPSSPATPEHTARRLELSRRSQAVAVFMIRSPFLQFAMRPLCHAIGKRFTWIPLLGDAVGQILELVDSLDKYHFYTCLS
eukprot:c11191_g1_i1.p1 GENE.c11191_g1_i1~~c11191_g1_i1.p1  ORF type:complete len:517 (-),score=84.56 c11191_g1_i1:164-1714(-)